MLYVLGPSREWRRGIEEAAKSRSHYRVQGRHAEYDGARCWLTRREAEQALQAHRKELSGHCVFGVKASVTDTAPAMERARRMNAGEDSTDVTWRDLVRDAIIVPLESEEYGFHPKGG